MEKTLADQVLEVCDTKKVAEATEDVRSILDRLEVATTDAWKSRDYSNDDKVKKVWQEISNETEKCRINVLKLSKKL